MAFYSEKYTNNKEESDSRPWRAFFGHDGWKEHIISSRYPGESLPAVYILRMGDNAWGLVIA
jgi:hypothetical protein